MEESPMDTTKRPARLNNGGRRSIFSVICAGVALMCDGYQNNLMTTSNLVFTKEYTDVYTSSLSTRVSNALLVGEVIGMLVVGFIVDMPPIPWLWGFSGGGRKRAMIFTTLCMIVGGILATAAHGVTTLGMFWMLIVARGIVGFGTGGEYPTSSATAAEAANETVKRRGTTFVLVTNLPLSLGGPFCIIVFLIVWEAAGGYNHLSTIWRVCFGIGCIWPLAIFIFRLRLVTSKLFKESAFIDYHIPWLMVFKFYWRRLVGTCGAWFLYDFITFPNGIFSGTIIGALVKDHDIKRTAEWQLLLGIIALPGVFVGAYLCEIIGRRNTMLIGFGGYLVLGLVIGCAFGPMSSIIPLFIVFYGLFNSMGNLGPGNMLGLVSTEAYATPVRGTLYGLSAAVGKAGAAVGTQVFRPIQNNLGRRWTFIIAAIIGLVGMIVTFFFIPHLREDDLAHEDERFYAYLRKHGYVQKVGREEGTMGSVVTSASQEDLSSDQRSIEKPLGRVTNVSLDDDKGIVS